MSHSEVDLQTILDRFAAASVSGGLVLASLPGYCTQLRLSQIGDRVRLCIISVFTLVT